jgi:TatD DNase family protein
MLRLIDGHAHLDEVEGLEAAMIRAGKAGVIAVVAVSSNDRSIKRTLEISGQYGDTVVYPALGIHPWDLQADREDTTLDLIEKNIHKAVGIGEIGLDYWLKDVRKKPDKKELQKRTYRKLLGLSKRYHKPALIHARGSWEDCLALALEVGVEKAVFHWYSGPLPILKKILNAGYFISATPAAQYSKNHQAAISEAPLENVLLETDTPVSYQGKPSEPAHVLRTLEAVADIKGIAKEQVAEITTKNALAFFDLQSMGNPRLPAR